MTLAKQKGTLTGQKLSLLQTFLTEKLSKLEETKKQIATERNLSDQELKDEQATAIKNFAMTTFLRCYKDEEAIFKANDVLVKKGLSNQQAFDKLRPDLMTLYKDFYRCS